MNPSPISLRHQMNASSISLRHHYPIATRLPTQNPLPTKSHVSFSPVRMSLKENAPSLAIVGVTGAVGQEFLSVLSDCSFPYRSLKLLASKRSAGKQINFEEKTYTVEELREDSFGDVDIALFSAGGSISKKFGPIAVENGAFVVDNSSAFRMDDGVPLVIPEVNPEALSHINIGSGKGALIANPNCSTIICLMASTPLHRHAKVKRMVVTTYQAASEELELQTREYAFNLFSQNAPILSNGYNEEEMKLVEETRKIWNDQNMKVTATCIRAPVMRAQAESVNLQFEKPLHENDQNRKATATCIRVPVMRAHAQNVNLQFEKPLHEDTARDILKNAPGVVVIDDRKHNRFPTALEVANKDAVAVGRIRRDISQDGDYGLDIFVCGDQIRKGAALNAVQIAEMLLK